jgi:hypothetical protein
MWVSWRNAVDQARVDLNRTGGGEGGGEDGPG